MKYNLQIKASILKFRIKNQKFQTAFQSDEENNSQPKQAKKKMGLAKVNKAYPYFLNENNP